MAVVNSFLYVYKEGNNKWRLNIAPHPRMSWSTKDEHIFVTPKIEQ